MDYCDIIIPVFNEKKLTQNCIERIKKYTRYPFRIVIIDNASDNDTNAYLKNEKANAVFPFILIRNDKNVGFLKAANQGFRKASSPYLCLLNNDTHVCDNWLSNMIELLDRRSDIGIVNPSSNVLGQYARMDTIDDFAHSTQFKRGQYQKMDFCRGFCMTFRKSLIDKVGFFDEVFGMGYFEEADFCRRTQREGYICVRAESSYVYHIDKATFASVNNLNNLFQRNKIIYYKKWGKPLWIAFIIWHNGSLPLFIETINILLDQGHKVIIFHKKEVNINGIEGHINLRIKEVENLFFLNFIYKLIERKKEKKIKAVLTDSLYNFLKYTEFYHKAKIFKKEENNLLTDFCKKLSFDENYIKEKD